ncbi:MAG: hypothetical protein A2Y02_00130 [Omnitrophica bacterium GWA2_52_12]|nr:MAG: hypothetical protein A2Y02_00130 [Omnitrophica bacterium GWA2_52_12]
MIVREVMNTSVVSISADASVREVYAVMTRYGTEDFPVVDDQQRLLGMVYEDRILQTLFPDVRIKFNEAEAHNDLGNIGKQTDGVCVHHVMTCDIRGVGPEANVLWAGALMLARGVRTLPVVENKKVIGTIQQQRIFLAVMKKHLETALPTEIPLKKSEAPAGVENRRFKRVALRIKVAYKLASAGGLPVQYEGKIAESINLSAGGMLLAVPEELPAERLVDVVFEIPGGHWPVKRLARVVRCAVVPKSGLFETAIMFLAMTAEEREEIQRYLAKNVSLK